MIGWFPGAVERGAFLRSIAASPFNQSFQVTGWQKLWKGEARTEGRRVVSEVKFREEQTWHGMVKA